MLFLLENVFCMPACLLLLIRLFSSFGKLNCIELPLELLQDDANDVKSMDFAHRLAFPIENGVELPPNVDENMELSAAKNFGTTGIGDNDNLEYDLPVKSGIPKWLQMQLQPETEQQAKLQLAVMQPKHIKSGKHRHAHSSITAAATTSPLRRCSIEISSKIPGICQGMGSIGNACISGEYIDVFNSECL